MPAFTQWMYNDPLQSQTGGAPGSGPKTYPIRGNGPEPWFRDRLDALRSARIPTAAYPDGYAGTVRSRREDRLTSSSGRMTQRNYQRGIHVGARVDPDSYWWTDDVHPMAGLEAQAKGERFTQKGEYSTHLINDGKAGPVRGSMSLQDPVRDRQYPSRLHPKWKS